MCIRDSHYPHEMKNASRSTFKGKTVSGLDNIRLQVGKSTCNLCPEQFFLVIKPGLRGRNVEKKFCFHLSAYCVLKFLKETMSLSGGKVVSSRLFKKSIGALDRHFQA